MYTVASGRLRVDFDRKRDAISYASELAANHATVYVWHVQRTGMQLIAVYEDGASVAL